MNKQEQLISKDKLLDIINRNSKHPICAVTIWQAVEKYLINQRVEAMGVQQEKEQPSLQSGKLSAEEVLYKHVLADADNHVMGTTLTVTVPPLEELKNNQQFQMHVAAMKEYAQQVYATAAPAKEVEAANTQIVEWDSLRGMFNKVATSEHVIGYLEQNGYYLVKKLAKEVEAISDSPDWKQLRDKFFKECTETYEAGKGLNVLRKVSYNIAPHDLFEWFKKELQAVEAIDASAKEGMKWVKASERLPDNEGIYKVKRVHSEGIETGEFICGAFTNYYGYRVMEWLDESAPAKEVEAISDSEKDKPLPPDDNALCFLVGSNVYNRRQARLEAAKEAISVPAQKGVEDDNTLEISTIYKVDKNAEIKVGDTYFNVSSRQIERCDYDHEANSCNNYKPELIWKILSSYRKINFQSAAQPLQPSLEEKKP
jgi:hypothetical protein